MEGKCLCSVTKYLNIISVLYKQTYNAVYYIMCFILLRQYAPLSTLAELSVVTYTGRNTWFCLNSKCQRERTLIATIYYLKLMHFIDYLTYIYHICANHIQNIQACCNQVIVYHHCTTVAHSEQMQTNPQKHGKHTLWDLMSVTSHYVSDCVHPGSNEELY